MIKNVFTPNNMIFKTPAFRPDLIVSWSVNQSLATTLNKLN